MLKKRNLVSRNLLSTQSECGKCCVKIFFFFWWPWGLNSGPHACLGRYSYHFSHSRSPFFMIGFFKIGSHELFAQASFKLLSSWSLGLQVSHRCLDQDILKEDGVVIINDGYVRVHGKIVGFTVYFYHFIMSKRKAILI
jgi:hypothetical protein